MRISDWSSDVCSPDLLPPTGTAVLNADDERVVAMRAVTSAEVVTYGTAGDVTATDVVLDEALQGRYRLRSPWGDVDVALAVRGRQQRSEARRVGKEGVSTGRFRGRPYH